MRFSEYVFGMHEAVNQDNPVGQFIGQLAQVCDRSGEVDVDGALFVLANAVVDLHCEVAERRADSLNLKSELLNLETRLREAGVRVRTAD